MNRINSFTFYSDYYNLIATTPVKNKQVLSAAILDYVFADIEPNLTGHDLAIFNTLRHQIDKSKNKSKNAKKENQNEIKQKSNENQNEINWGSKTSILSFKFYILNFNYFRNKDLLVDKLLEWIDYKQQKNDYFEEITLKALLVEIKKYSSLYGDEVVIALINECIANSYKGIVWDKLKNLKPKENIPSWFNQDIDSKDVSVDEQEAFREHLKHV